MVKKNQNPLRSDSRIFLLTSNKLFFRLAIRLLYQDISYNTPAHFFHNIPFWERDWTEWGLENLGLEKNIFETPRSVVIGRELGYGLTMDHYYFGGGGGPQHHHHPSASSRNRIRFGTHLYNSNTNNNNSNTRLTREIFPAALDPLSDLLTSFSNLQNVSFQQAMFSFKIGQLLHHLPPSIRSLSFEHCTFLTPIAPLDSAVPLLTSLTSYTGPVDFLKSTLRGCGNLEKIVFPTTVRDVDALMSDTLPFAAAMVTRSFDVTLQKWDIEIMHAVIAELPSLEELTIRIWEGFPSEDVLVSFGPEFLARLVNIRILHMYSLFPRLVGPFRMPDAHECVVGWEKYSPRLREVRLADASVWRRDGVGEEWGCTGGGGSGRRELQMLK
ncbi:hypothetical protein D9757_001598 [Collybiopsis confluens]|uniref:Uncharacterized protein n=1 Tax=Collybiopsis confluens TaxID=2823264 RepID=A0A8H5HZ65_9AGAR|nr:hypothetical protein D9757_001598 [Collybiopsis confluens]